MRTWTKGCLLVCVTSVLLTACGAAPVKKEEPVFQPRFSYKASASGAKIDVTVGLVRPQFSASGQAFWAQNRQDAVVKSFVGGLDSSFNELLVAKGFNVAGPYDALDNMTFPEKKGSDFVLYPEIEIEGGVKVDNIGTRQEFSLLGSGVVATCDIVLSSAGQINIVVKEPLSGEKMWYKRIPLETLPKTVKAEGSICTGASTAMPVQVKNDWGRMYQEIYKTVMSNLDKYVNAEEFQMLKRQSAELRSKKTY